MLLEILTLFQTIISDFSLPFFRIEPRGIKTTKSHLLNHTQFQVLVLENVQTLAQISDPQMVPKFQYPISDLNGAKTTPFGTAHTYIAYKREYSRRITCSTIFSTGSPPLGACRAQVSQTSQGRYVILRKSKNIRVLWQMTAGNMQTIYN